MVSISDRQLFVFDSDKKGNYGKDDKRHYMMATICKALEIDHEGTYDVDGRPVPYTNTGSEPIAELF